MEDFVPFELAVKLKEKGFSLNKEDIEFIGCRLIFSDECTIKRISTIGAYNKEYFGENIDCPTIQQVLKWLRKEKEIDIILQPIFLYNENNREREYGIEIYAPQLNKPTHLDYFKNWGKGAVAGIEYVLDNLI